MLSVGAIRFENKFCGSKRGRIGGGGWVLAQGVVHMVAGLIGCTKTLVGTCWVISLLFNTMDIEKGSIAGTAHSFHLGEAFTGLRVLTIVSLIMSGHGRGHEP